MTVELADAIKEFGFPIIAAFGLGYFVYYVWVWVTREIKDSKGKLIMAKDNVVDPDFSITFYDTGLSINVTKSGVEARTAVSNYEYETLLNDKKRNIFVLKPEFLQQFLNDFRDLMVYDNSSQFINDNVIQTENTSITLP